MLFLKQVSVHLGILYITFPQKPEGVFYKFYYWKGRLCEIDVQI
jgi:hypothetical protein